MPHVRRRSAGVSFLLSSAVAVPCAVLAVAPGTSADALAVSPAGNATARLPNPTAGPPLPGGTAAPGRAGVTGAATPSCIPAPLEQRAGAVIMVGLPGVTQADDPLARQVIDLGVSGVFLAAQNVRTPEQVRELTTGLRAQAGRPLLISTDEESGRVAATRAVVGAGRSPRRLARTRTPEQVKQLALGIGQALNDVGINLDFAPVVDLDDGPASGVIGDRSFGAEPGQAEEFGRAFAEGLAAAGVTPTLKHFPGQGRSPGDTHTGRSQVTADLGELQVSDLSPFQRLIDDGAPMVMLNHLDYTALDPELPASLSPAAYTLLRDMGFDGVAITDSLGMGAVNLRFDFPEAAVRAIEAGADVAFATDGNQAARMRAAILGAVGSGRLTEERINEAASRVAALAGWDPVALTCRPAEPAAFPAG
jgi:beta-N-acetylhexosaminidase